MPPIKPQIKHSTFARQRLTLGGLMGFSGSSMGIITPHTTPSNHSVKGRYIHLYYPICVQPSFVCTYLMLPC